MIPIGNKWLNCINVCCCYAQSSPYHYTLLFSSIALVCYFFFQVNLFQFTKNRIHRVNDPNISLNPFLEWFDPFINHHLVTPNGLRIIIKQSTAASIIIISNGSFRYIQACFSRQRHRSLTTKRMFVAEHLQMNQCLLANNFFPSFVMTEQITFDFPVVVSALHMYTCVYAVVSCTSN